jgi:hypothetical protein
MSEKLVAYVFSSIFELRAVLDKVKEGRASYEKCDHSTYY